MDIGQKVPVNAWRTIKMTNTFTHIKLPADVFNSPTHADKLRSMLEIMKVDTGLIIIDTEERYLPYVECDLFSVEPVVNRIIEDLWRLITQSNRNMAL